MKANGFFKQTPNSVPLDGAPHGARHAEPNHNPVVARFRWPDKTPNRPAGKSLSLCQNTGKRPVSTEGLPDRAVARQWIVIVSGPLLTLVADSQLLASLCPPTVDDLAAVLRRHTSTEPVCIAAFAFVRLECSFHCLLDRSVSSIVFEGTDFFLHLQPRLTYCRSTAFYRPPRSIALCNFFSCVHIVALV